ncbi:TonB-dependent receptor [Weeksellaceae bacterium A-14]
MKNFISLFILLFAGVMMYGQQKVISGKITDSDGQPVPSASVTVEAPGSDAILAYGISNSKGEYKVNFTTSTDNVDMKVKAFNQKSILKTVKSESQNLNFKMESEATEIKEVKIKTKLITKRGDTIAYDLKSFESKADRTLADVLKKIPGLEVQSDGTILYQGEAINKFYVNGKDLMEGGYAQISNALPKDAVSKVEVMENHQPVKILQDKVPSENAAINIKLKNKVTMTGRGEVGIGGDPLLWNVKLTPMFFGQKNQWVVNYKSNNNGESVENEGNMLAFGNRWEGARSQASPRNWLSVDQASTPSLPEKRYLMNSVHFLSANLLTNPFKNKEWELKLNANYANNAIDRDSYRETVYDPSDLFPDGATNATSASNKFYTNSAKGQMIFQKNAKKGFFKNTTTWNGFWDEDRSILNIDDETKLNESMSSPTGVISNSLSTIIPWKEKLVNFMSYISYQKDRQRMTSLYSNFKDFNTILDTDQLSRLDQRLSLTTLTANHSASVGFSYKKWTITPEAGLNLSYNSMDSQMYNNQVLLGSSFQNDMKWNEVNPYVSTSLNYKGQALNLNIGLPVNFYDITYKDQIRDSSKKISKTAFTPSLWASYDFASFFKLWGFASMNYNFGDFGDLYEGNLLLNPRSISNNESILPDNRSTNASTRLEYRNPLNNLFFNIRYSYGQYKRNLISRTQQFASGAAITDLYEYDNKSLSQSESAEIGKYFPNFKTNASVSFSNRDSNSYALIVNADENEFLTETKTNGQSLALKFNNTFFSWLSLDYNISLNWSKNTNLYQNTVNRNSGWSHNMAAYIYPLENHTLGFFWDDMTTEQSGQHFRNSFYDLSYQYTWSKKKIDFEIKWLNIGNRKVYETVAYNASTLSTTRSIIKIRPSQVMFTVKFNFK